MLAIALKNSILICLIVSIGYFIIDNHLSELRYEVESDKLRPKEIKLVEKKSKTPKKSNVVREIVKESSEETKEIIAEQTPAKNDTKNSEETSSPTKMRITIDDNMKEIYSYVYGDSRASDNLNEMYQTAKNGDVEKDINVLCDTPEEEKYKRVFR